MQHPINPAITLVGFEVRPNDDLYRDALDSYQVAERDFTQSFGSLDAIDTMKAAPKLPYLQA